MSCLWYVLYIDWLANIVQGYCLIIQMNNEETNDASKANSTFITIKLHCSHLIASNKPWLDWASFFIFFVIFWLLCTELRTIPSLSVQLKAATLNQGIRMCPTSIYTCLFDPLQLHNWFVAYKMIRKKCFPSNVKLFCWYAE